MKLIKRICYNIKISWLATREFESFKLIYKSLRNLLLRNFFPNCDETEEELKENDGNIDSDQVPHS